MTSRMMDASAVAVDPPQHEAFGGIPVARDEAAA
jgi:hypothetical protein